LKAENAEAAIGIRCNLFHHTMIAHDKIYNSENEKETKISYEMNLTNCN